MRLNLAGLPRDEVEAYLSGVSRILSGGDDAVTAAIAGLEGGSGRLLRFLAAGMELAFRPDRAAGETGLVEFRIQTPEDGEAGLWAWLGTDGCQVSDTGSDPDTTITIPLAVFARIAFKRTTGTDAYMDGLVHATGDVVLATTLDEWFDSPDAAAMTAFERPGAP